MRISQGLAALDRWAAALQAACGRLRLPYMALVATKADNARGATASSADANLQGMETVLAQSYNMFRYSVSALSGDGTAATLCRIAADLAGVPLSASDVEQIAGGRLRERLLQDTISDSVPQETRRQSLAPGQVRNHIGTVMAGQALPHCLVHTTLTATGPMDKLTELSLWPARVGLEGEGLELQVTQVETRAGSNLLRTPLQEALKALMARGATYSVVAAAVGLLKFQLITFSQAEGAYISENNLLRTPLREAFNVLCASDEFLGD
eukprot:gene32229-16791_t